jgi:hypothetical protein
MGNDIAAHRAAIGLFYCKTNEISLKTVFYTQLLTNIYKSITRAFYLTFCQNSQFIEKNIKRENSDF